MAHKVNVTWDDKDWCEKAECLCDVKQALANLATINWNLKEINESLKRMSGAPAGSSQKKSGFDDWGS